MKSRIPHAAYHGGVTILMDDPALYTIWRDLRLLWLGVVLLVIGLTLMWMVVM
jgi:hypothetical protein